MMVVEMDSDFFGIEFILSSGERHLFSTLPIMIGRSEDNDLTLSKETVSAVHAMVYFDKRLFRVCISDQDSLNGIYINRLPTRINVLNDGMEISLGDEMITYQDQGFISPVFS